MEVLYNGTLSTGPPLDSLPDINPNQLIFVKIDLSAGIPEEVFSCSNCKILGFYRCNLSQLDHRLAQLEIEQLDLAENNFTEYPQVLTLIPTLRRLNLDDNKITKLPSRMEYPDLNIYLKNQTIQNMPEGNVKFQNACFLKGNINAIFENIHGKVILGFNWKWMNDTSRLIEDCCQDVIFYTHRGDRLLNTSLRLLKLVSEFESLYNILMNAKNNSINLPIGGILYRGINYDLVHNIGIGDVISDYGFSSFSMLFETALTFSKHIIVLEIIDDISGIFFNIDYKLTYYDEKEILLGPGLNLQITKIEKYADVTCYFVKIISLVNPVYEGDFLFPKIVKVYNLMKTYDGVILHNKFFKSDPKTLLSQYKIFESQGISMFKPYETKYDFIYEIMIQLMKFSSITVLKGNLPLDLNNKEEKLEVNVDGNISHIASSEFKKYISSQRLLSWTDKSGLVNYVTYHFLK